MIPFVPDGFSRSLGSDLLSDNYNITLKYDLSFATFVSSSTMTKVENKKDSTVIFIPLEFFDLESELFGAEAIGKSKTQEFRLVGNSANSFDWVVGAFYSEVENKSFSRSGYVGIVDGPIVSQFVENNRGSVKNDSMAIYADIIYDVSDQLSFSVGTRYFEDKSVSVIDLSEVQTIEYDSDSHNLSSKISISYTLASDTRIYIRIAEGFRTGGLNPSPDLTIRPNVEYGPEELLSYELGVKSTLFDGRLNTEGAVFVTMYDDFQQINSDLSNGLPGLILNVGEIEIKGVEWSARATVSEQLSTGFSLSLVDSEFVESGSASYEVGDNVDSIPRYNFSLYADLTFDWFNSVGGYFHIDYSRQGRQTFILRNQGREDPVLRSPSIGFLNMQVGAKWNSIDVNLFGRNLSNEVRETGPNIIATNQSRPRTIGVSVGYEF